jgi:hypothetical protein
LVSFVDDMFLFPLLCAFVSSYPFIPLTWSLLSVSLCASIWRPARVIYHCRGAVYRCCQPCVMDDTNCYLVVYSPNVRID